MADLDVGCEQDGPVVASTAEWLAALSEQARAQGNGERADRLLLLAWRAYDGQKISLVDVDVAEGEHAVTGTPMSWNAEQSDNIPDRAVVGRYRAWTLWPASRRNRLRHVWQVTSLAGGSAQPERAPGSSAQSDIRQCGVTAWNTAVRPGDERPDFRSATNTRPAQTMAFSGRRLLGIWAGVLRRRRGFGQPLPAQRRPECQFPDVDSRGDFLGVKRRPEPITARREPRSRC